MASFITPVRPIDTAPPWDWNPGATFLTAFNAAQENKRRNEEMALENELAQILLPQKRAEAEFNLKKLAYDTERLTLVNKLGIEEIEAKRKFLRTNGLGLGGGGTSGPTSTGASGLRSTVRIRNPKVSSGVSSGMIADADSQAGLPSPDGWQEDEDTLIPPSPLDP
jgi:hypothetical protein